MGTVVKTAAAHAPYCAKFKPDREMQNDIQCMINDTKINDWGHLAGDIVKIRKDMANRTNTSDARSVKINNAMLQLLSVLEIDLKHLDKPDVKSSIVNHIYLIQVLDTIWTKHEQIAKANYCLTTVHVDELHNNLAKWFSGTELATLQAAIAHMKNDLLEGEKMYYHISNDLDVVLNAVADVSAAHEPYVNNIQNTDANNGGDESWVIPVAVVLSLFLIALVIVLVYFFVLKKKQMKYKVVPKAGVVAYSEKDFDKATDVVFKSGEIISTSKVTKDKKWVYINKDGMKYWVPVRRDDGEANLVEVVEGVKSKDIQMVPIDGRGSMEELNVEEGTSGNGKTDGNQVGDVE